MTDAAGNVTEQSVVVNKLDKSKVPQNLVGSADGLSWDGTRYAESYQVELAPKDSDGVISIETADTQVDIYTSAECGSPFFASLCS